MQIEGRTHEETIKSGEINQGVPDEHNGRQEVKLDQYTREISPSK